MRVRALFALVAAGSAAACFSFGDLSGGGDDSMSSDAAADSTTGDDGESAGDSSRQGGDPDGSPSTPFCQNVDATFCADFDESPDAMTGFSSLYISDGGIIGLDDEFTSMPQAFFAGTDTIASGVSAHGSLVRHTAVAPSKGIRLAFDIRTDRLSTQNSVVEALAIVNNSSTRSSLQLNVKSTSTEVGEEIVGLDGGVTYTAHVFSKPLPVTDFAHVQIVIATLPTSRELTVIVSGQTMVDHVSMNPAFVFGPVDLYLGNAYSPGPSDGSRIHYDNVSLTVE